MFSCTALRTCLSRNAFIVRCYGHGCIPFYHNSEAISGTFIVIYEIHEQKLRINLILNSYDSSIGGQNGINLKWNDSTNSNQNTYSWEKTLTVHDANATTKSTMTQTSLGLTSRCMRYTARLTGRPRWRPGSPLFNYLSIHTCVNTIS